MLLMNFLSALVNFNITVIGSIHKWIWGRTMKNIRPTAYHFCVYNDTTVLSLAESCPNILASSNIATSNVDIVISLVALLSSSFYSPPSPNLMNIVVAYSKIYTSVTFSSFYVELSIFTSVCIRRISTSICSVFPFLWKKQCSLSEVIFLLAVLRKAIVEDHTRF